MSYSLLLSRKDKSRINKKRLEEILWHQHWVARLPEHNRYALIHNADQVYIEISLEKRDVEDEFSEPRTFDVIELQTWASSSEWSIVHMLRLVEILSQSLNLIIYDPQLGKLIKDTDYDSIEDSYLNWRQRVEAINLKLFIEPKKELYPISVFVGHSYQIEDDLVSDYIINSLRNRVREVYTGRPPQISSLSKKVIEKIENSDIVVAILTRRERISKDRWETSQWVLDEAAYAFGKGKEIIFIKEAGVKDLPGIYGDKEYILLNRVRLADCIKEVDDILADLAKNKGWIKTRSEK